MTPAERERLIEELLAAQRDWLTQRLVDAPHTLEEIEATVAEIGQQLEHELERRLLEHQRQSTEVPAENQARCPRCGGLGRFRAPEERLLITRHGEHPLVRRRYYCQPCGAGFCPLDQRLGLDAGETSLQVREWVAQLAPRVALPEGNILLKQLTGVQLGSSTFARLAVGTGTALRQAEQTAGARHHAGQPPPVERKPRRLYVSVDGIFAPLREPWKKDGSLGALVCRPGECKTAAVYEANEGEQGDEGVRWCAYTATLGDIAVFTPLVATLAHRAGHHFAHEVVFLADGQAYNWTLAASQFPTAIQIVDFQHAMAHLYALAYCFFGEGSTTATEWVEARQEELLRDQVQAVGEAIAALVPGSDKQRTEQAKEAGYFRSNAERMRYQSFRKRGYQIATGVMEAGCKRVVHQRLDQAGMHWRQETAEAIVALRAAVLSSNPPDLRPFCRLAP
jgi:hypothetical protein